MQWETISIERAKKIEESSNNLITFDVVDDKIVGVTFCGPDGPIALKIESYSVSVCEPKRKTMWCLTAGMDVTYHETMEEAFEHAKYVGSNKSVSIETVNVEVNS